jgi:hypothetical protein
MTDDNDTTDFERQRRRDLERYLRNMDRRAAALESLLADYDSYRADYPDKPRLPTAVVQRWLAHLDRERAHVKDMLAGRLPLDAKLPETPRDILAALVALLKEHRQWLEKFK